MITPKKEEVFRVFDFISKHERDALNGLFSSINIITKEEIVLITRITTVLE